MSSDLKSTALKSKVHGGTGDLDLEEKFELQVQMNIAHVSYLG